MNGEPLPYSTAAALEVVRRGKERVSQRVERSRDLGAINPDDANDLAALEGAEWFLSRIHADPMRMLRPADDDELAALELPERFTNGYSRAEIATCLKRELAMRKKAYPKWVAAGTMKQPDADREIALMQTAARVFENAVSLEMDLS